MKHDFDVYCVNLFSHKVYLEGTFETSELCEKYGYKGILLTYSNRIPNPWIIAATLVQKFEITPFIALNPYSVPPVTAAKMVQTFMLNLKKKVDINFVTGLSKSNLQELCDERSHEERYKQLNEYIELMKLLLTSSMAVKFHGDYYHVENYYTGISEVIEYPYDLLPKMYVSGSSRESINTQIKYSDSSLTQPGPINHYKIHLMESYGDCCIEHGISIGIIARETRTEAWNAAKNLYPIQRKAILETKLKSKSESHWTRTISDLALQNELYDDVFWLGSFKSGTYNPFIVGDYEQVAEYLEKYLQLGVKTIVINDPFPEEEFIHRDKVFKLLR